MHTHTCSNVYNFSVTYELTDWLTDGPTCLPESDETDDDDDDESNEGPHQDSDGAYP